MENPSTIDKITHRAEELSLDEPSLRSRLIKWSENTNRGKAIKVNFDDAAQHSTDEEIEDSLGFLVLGHPEWSKLLPSDLQSAVLGPDHRKKLGNKAHLIELVKAGDFADFVRRAWVEPASQGKTLKPDDEAVKLHSAFNSRFTGRNVDWLRDAIERYDNMYYPRSHYGKMIVFVQSRATGKSRTLEELSKQCLLLTICFRDIEHPDIIPSKGWPPGDKPICNFFLNPPKHGETVFTEEELAGAFLGALMAVVAEQLEGIQSAEAEAIIDTFRKPWTIEDPRPEKIRHSQRQALLQQVQSRATEILVANHAQLLDIRVPRLSFPSNASDSVNKSISRIRNIFNLLTYKHAKALEQACAKLSQPRFIFAFDECSELDKCRETRADGMSLFGLKRMINTLDSFNFWFIFTDTDPGIVDVRPATDKSAKSFRLQADLVPLPMYPYIQWDIMVQPNHCAKTPLDALKFEYLKNYGRPYWSTLNTEMVLNAAIIKLLSTEDFEPYDPKHVFAVLSARLLLELGTGEASRKLAIGAVKNNMRILTAMSDTGTAETCAPSEPMLAIAAAEALLESERTYQDAMKCFVNKLILNGHVLERGLQGELLPRILFMLARDYAVSARGSRKQRRTVLAVDIITFGDFLNALLGKNLGIRPTRQEWRKAEETGAQEKEAVEQETLTRKILEWASIYHLNFTHFYQLEEHIDELSPDFLIECWRRGVALTCVCNQAIFDLILVVYRGDLSKPFDSSKFGLVSVRVKLRGGAEGIIGQLTCPIVVEKTGNTVRRWKPDHIVILMDLDTRTEFSNGSMVQFGYDKARRKYSGSQAWRGYLDESEEPKRYLIIIRGRSPLQYPVIREFAPGLTGLWSRERLLVPEQFLDMATAMDGSLHPLHAQGQ